LPDFEPDSFIFERIEIDMNVIRQNTDYALRMMVILGRHYGDEPVSTRVLSRRGGVSYQFACKIMQQLHDAGLVKSMMGPKGGFCLAKMPSKISILQVITALQGPVSINKCFGIEGCERKPNCPISAKLAGIQKHVEASLRSITLAEVLKYTSRGKNRKRGN
jgi:Rrf2 family protein